MSVTSGVPGVAVDPPSSHQVNLSPSQSKPNSLWLQFSPPTFQIKMPWRSFLLRAGIKIARKFVRKLFIQSWNYLKALQRVPEYWVATSHLFTKISFQSRELSLRQSWINGEQRNEIKLVNSGSPSVFSIHSVCCIEHWAVLCRSGPVLHPVAVQHGADRAQPGGDREEGGAGLPGPDSVLQCVNWMYCRSATTAAAWKELPWMFEPDI